MNVWPNLRDPEFLGRLDSATKYPSIPTYHVIERGVLQEERTVAFDASERVIVTEKINGTNGRVVFLPDGSYLIGSRDRFLTHSDDVVADPSLGIVEALRWRVDADRVPDPSCIVAVYGEVYGGKIGGGKAYTGDGAVGVRIFDVATLPFEILDRDRAAIAAWREAGGQPFLNEGRLNAMIARLAMVRVPQQSSVDVPDTPPGTLADTAVWLRDVAPKSSAILSDGGTGRPEGVVVRNADRSKIAKLRFEDYERALRGRR